MMSLSRTVMTALAIVLDIPEVDHVRKFNDRAWARWPAHINLIFPFVPLTKELHDRVARAVRDFAPFKIRLARLGRFQQRHTWTHHIVPEAPELELLFQAIRAALPEVVVKHATFQPHITVGQGAEAATFLEQLDPVMGREITVDRISLLQRSATTPFEVVATVPLEKKLDAIPELEEVD
jgi:2'-5' RNA ligase